MADEMRTARLLMRRATMADLPAIHAILSDPVATRYWSTPPHDNLETSEDWLRSMVEIEPEVGDDFVIELDGEVVGKVGCWRFPEIGFLLSPAVWGQGLANEALAAFLHRRRAFGSPNPIVADVDPRNTASLRLLNRNGFVETARAARTWHIGGKWSDSVYLEFRF